MGRTLYDKIWQAHKIVEGADGQTLLHVARHLVHDGSVHAFEFLRDRGLKVRRPDQVFATPDHGVSTLVHKVDAIADPEQRRVVQLLDRNTARSASCISRSTTRARASCMSSAPSRASPCPAWC